MMLKSKLRRRLTAHRYRRQQRALVLVLIFALVGTAIIMISQAATPTASIQAEAGIASTNAEKITGNSAASGDGYVKFKAATTSLPSYCTQGGNQLWTNLSLCTNWAGPTNTGPVASECPSGMTALNSSGTGADPYQIVVASGQSLTCKNVTGCLKVGGPNVTIKNVTITCQTPWSGTAVDSHDSGHGAIFVPLSANAVNTVISQVTIDATKSTHTCVSYFGNGSISIDKINCKNANDGIFMCRSGCDGTAGTADNFKITNSYFHDFTHLTANGHVDGIQTEGSGCSGCTNLIEHNTILMTSYADAGYGKNDSNGGIALWNSQGTTENVDVNNNLMAGAGQIIYSQDYSPSDTSAGGGYEVRKTYFNNNRFSQYVGDGVKADCVGDNRNGSSGAVWFSRNVPGNSAFTWPPYYGGPTDGWHRSGNIVMETQENVDNSNPHIGSFECW